MLNEKIFQKVVDKKFLDQKEYCIFFKKKFKFKNISYLNPKLTLHIKKNNYAIKSDNLKNITDFNIKKLKSNFPKINPNYKLDDLVKDLNIAVNSLKQKINSYKLSINKINQTAFFILIKKINKIFYINLKDSVCEEVKYKKDEIKKKFKN